MAGSPLIPADIGGIEKLGHRVIDQGGSAADVRMQQQQLAQAIGSLPPQGYLGTLAQQGLGGVANRWGQDASRFAREKVAPALGKMIAPLAAANEADNALLMPSASAATQPTGVWTPPPKPTNEAQLQANAHLAGLVQQYHRGDATKDQVVRAIGQLDQGWMKAFGAPNADAAFILQGIEEQEADRLARASATGMAAPRMSQQQMQNAAAALTASREMRRRKGGAKPPAMPKPVAPSGSEMPANRRLPRE